jgi:outer membrane lipoprotein SlyB
MSIKSLAVKSAVIAATLSLGACATGSQYAANSYSANQVNQRQEAKTVSILAVLPAHIEVDNSQNRKAVQTGAAILGAIAGGIIGGQHGAVALGALAGAGAGAVAGSVTPGSNSMNGVSIAYQESGHVYNSAQIGQICEFKVGMAIMVSTGGSNTRIQPNSECGQQQATK